MPNRDRKGKHKVGRDYYDNDSEGEYKRNQPKGRNKSGDRDGRKGYDDDNNNDKRDDYDTKNIPRGAQNKGRPITSLKKNRISIRNWGYKGLIMKANYIDDQFVKFPLIIDFQYIII